MSADAPRTEVLTGVVDGFGRTLAFHRKAAGELAGKSPGGRTARVAVFTGAEPTALGGSLP